MARTPKFYQTDDGRTQKLWLGDPHHPLKSFQKDCTFRSVSISLIVTAGNDWEQSTTAQTKQAKKEHSDTKTSLLAVIEVRMLSSATKRRATLPPASSFSNVVLRSPPLCHTGRHLSHRKRDWNRSKQCTPCCMVIDYQSTLLASCWWGWRGPILLATSEETAVSISNWFPSWSWEYW